MCDTLQRTQIRCGYVSKAKSLRYVCVLIMISPVLFNAHKDSERLAFDMLICIFRMELAPRKRS